MKLVYICPDIGIDFGRSKVLYDMISFLRTNCPNYSITLITNAESKIKIFEKLNLNIIHMPISIERRNPIYFLISFYKLLQFAILNKIEIIHSHHRYTDLLTFLVSLITNIKTITTVHSFNHGFNKFSYNVDIITCVSNSVKEHILKKCNINYDKIKVIHNGIKSYGTKLKAIDYSEKSKFTVLCIGRFDYEKGQDILLKAFEKIWKYETNINLVLIGEYSKYFMRYSNKTNSISHDFKTIFNKLLNKHSKKIKIHTSNSTPWKEICSSDLVVIPSRIETFGLVALEAGTLSKCVVASNTGGLKEIIKNKKNGLLFESENYIDLSQKILFLYENRKLLYKYGKELYKDIQINFTLEKMMEEYTKQYDQLLEMT